MFGMLDYRANKLFLIIFGIPWFLLRWIAILALPLFWLGKIKRNKNSWLGNLYKLIDEE